MSRRLPLYAEKAFGELQATRGYTATEFERQFRAEHPVTCKAGCSNCCAYPVLITIGEGILLYRFLAGKGRLTSGLKKKLREHSDLTHFMDFGVWMRANIPCPLLDEKQRCAGYESRPLACRLRFSTGDPDDCHPHTFDPGNMASLQEMAPVVAAFENRLLQSHGVSKFRMPIGRALQLAERVLSGEVDLKSIELVLFQEYMAT